MGLLPDRAGVSHGLCLLGLVVFSRCGPSSPTERVTDPGPLAGPFAVSNAFTPSGHMGDGETLGHIIVDVNEHCKERPPNATGDCYRFTYHPGAVGWAGVYWVFPANNWGSRAGRRVVPGQYSQVRVRAACDRAALPVNFIVGGIADPTLPHRDRVSAAASEPLNQSWREIHLDIAGQDFNEVIGAFAWSLAFPADLRDTPGATVTLYLDDLMWDTAPLPGP